MNNNRTWLAALVLGLAAASSVAAEPVARGVIVQLKASPDGRESPQAVRERLSAVAHDSGLALHQPAQPVGAQHHLLRFDAPLRGAALDAAVRRVRLNPAVSQVEPDLRLKRQAEPNDPSYLGTAQWYLKTPAVGGSGAINLPPAWARTTGQTSGVVAVVDTGVVFGHPDLQGRLLPGYDMVSDVAMANDGDGRDADASDPGDWVSEADVQQTDFSDCMVEDSSWHGTFIAGQIGAATDNGVGVAGVNWGAKVLPVRIAGKCGGWTSDVIDGVRWAAGLTVSGAPANPTPARVINLSFGGNTSCTAAYQAAVDEVTAAGALLVVAAGNDNGPVTRPADCRGVLGVGSVRQDGMKSGFSNYGLNLGLMAPGGSGGEVAGPQIYSTYNAGTRGPTSEHTYAALSGTSFAAPLAAGVASLMLSLNPALQPAEVIARLQASARPFPSLASYPSCSTLLPVDGPCNCTQATCGPGLMDADRALSLANSPAVVIAPIADVTPGSTVQLDGRGSSPIAGTTIVSYQWSLFSGSDVTLNDANAAVASVRLPTEGVWLFRLVVTDSLGRSADNYVTVRAVNRSPFSVSTSTSPGGATGLLWGAGLWLLAALAWRRRSTAT